MTINSLTLPWPSHRLLLPKIPTTTLLKNLCHLWHQNDQTLCLLEASRPSTKRLRKRRKCINVWINSGNKVDKVLALPLLPAPKARLGKTCFRSCTLIVTRKSTTRGTILSQEKTCQKIIISRSNLCPNNWH